MKVNKHEQNWNYCNVLECETNRVKYKIDLDFIKINFCNQHIIELRDILDDLEIEYGDE